MLRKFKKWLAFVVAAVMLVSAQTVLVSAADGDAAELAQLIADATLIQPDEAKYTERSYANFDFALGKAKIIAAGLPDLVATACFVLDSGIKGLIEIPVTDTTTTEPEEPDTTTTEPEEPDTTTTEPEEPDTTTTEPEEPDTTTTEDETGTSDTTTTEDETGTSDTTTTFDWYAVADDIMEQVKVDPEDIVNKFYDIVSKDIPKIKAIAENLIAPAGLKYSATREGTNQTSAVSGLYLYDYWAYIDSDPDWDDGRDVVVRIGLSKNKAVPTLIVAIFEIDDDTAVLGYVELALTPVEWDAQKLMEYLMELYDLTEKEDGYEGPYKELEWAGKYLTDLIGGNGAITSDGAYTITGKQLNGLTKKFGENATVKLTTNATTGIDDYYYEEALKDLINATEQMIYFLEQCEDDIDRTIAPLSVDDYTKETIELVIQSLLNTKAVLEFAKVDAGSSAVSGALTAAASNLKSVAQSQLTTFVKTKQSLPEYYFLASPFEQIIASFDKLILAVDSIRLLGNPTGASVSSIAATIRTISDALKAGGYASAYLIAFEAAAFSQISGESLDATTPSYIALTSLTALNARNAAFAKSFADALSGVSHSGLLQAGKDAVRPVTLPDEHKTESFLAVMAAETVFNTAKGLANITGIWDNESAKSVFDTFLTIHPLLDDYANYAIEYLCDALDHKSYADDLSAAKYFITITSTVITTIDESVGTLSKPYYLFFQGHARAMLSAIKAKYGTLDYSGFAAASDWDIRGTLTSWFAAYESEFKGNNANKDYVWAGYIGLPNTSDDDYRAYLVYDKADNKLFIKVFDGDPANADTDWDGEVAWDLDEIDYIVDIFQW